MYRALLKGVVLVLLVISSVILTYKIWNFRPAFDRLETPMNQTSVARPSTDNLKNVMMPFQVVNYTEDRIKGTTDKEMIEKYLFQITGAKVAIKSSNKNVSHLFGNRSNRFTILDFTGKVPVSTYFDQVLNISTYDEKEMIERMIIDSQESEYVTIHLLTSNKKIIELKTEISSQSFRKFIKNTNKDMENYTGIITNQKTTDEQTNIYVPSHPEHREAFKYLAETVNVQDINNAVLGSKEAIIERSGKKNEKIFNSNTGIVTVANNETYKYNNLSEVDRSKHNPLHNLMNAYDFVNNHNGFSDDYRYFDVNNEGAITYRMYLKGYPVFDNNGMSEINVIWGNKDVYEYRRGLYSTSVAVPTKHEVKKLPSAEVVRYELASSKYRFEAVTNMAVGYYMKKTKSPEIQATLSFEPAWFVEYEGKWMRYVDGRLE